MKRYTCLMIVAVVCMTAVFGMATVQAAGTGPYLAGYWSLGKDEHTAYFVTNPTVKSLDVYAVFLDITGTFVRCYQQEVTANDTWYVTSAAPPTSDETGVVKFFAFPKDSLRFDPNAVIGGYQRRIDCDKYNTKWYPNVTDENLSAIPINSSTIAEFGLFPLSTCVPFPYPYRNPPTYCHNLNEDS